MNTKYTTIQDHDSGQQNMNTKYTFLLPNALDDWI